jgi:hypothetical protein
MSLLLLLEAGIGAAATPAAAAPAPAASPSTTATAAAAAAAAAARPTGVACRSADNPIFNCTANCVCGSTPPYKESDVQSIDNITFVVPLA